MNKQYKIGDKVLVRGIVNSEVSNGGIHVLHDGVDTFYTLDQINDQAKVVVPKFVAEWIEEKKKSGIDLHKSMAYEVKADVFRYIMDNSETYARAWLDGYEIEQEKKYKVTMPSLYEEEQVLHFSLEEEVWYFGDDCNDNVTINKDSRYHTKVELKQAGFSGVFDNPMFELEEVE